MKDLFNFRGCGRILFLMPALLFWPVAPCSARNQPTHHENTILKEDPFWPAGNMDPIPPRNAQIRNERVTYTRTGIGEIDALLDERRMDVQVLQPYPQIDDGLLLVLGAQRGITEMVDYALQRDVPPNYDLPAEIRSRYGMPCGTALICAAMYGQTVTARQLLAAGADPDYLSSTGQIALHATIAQENWRTAIALLENGADVNARMRYDYTPLHVSVDLRYPLMTELLLRAGADPNVRCIDAFTPLHYAAANVSAYNTKTLILYGADVFAQARDGRRPSEMIGALLVSPKPKPGNAVERLLKHYEQEYVATEVEEYARQVKGDLHPNNTPQRDPRRRGGQPSLQRDRADFEDPAVRARFMEEARQNATRIMRSTNNGLETVYPKRTYTREVIRY